MTNSAIDSNAIEEDSAVLILATLRAVLERVGIDPVPYGSVGHIVSVEFLRDKDTNELLPDKLVVHFSNADVLVNFYDMSRLPK